jgi:hypothetical protein
MRLYVTGDGGGVQYTQLVECRGVGVHMEEMVGHIIILN